MARRPAYEGHAAIFVHVRADARVEAHGTDVHAVPVVAHYDVYGPDFAVY